MIDIMNRKKNEEWVCLEEFPNYEINRSGQLRNAKTGRIKKAQPTRGRGAAFVMMIDKNGLEVYIDPNNELEIKKYGKLGYKFVNKRYNYLIKEYGND